MTDILRESPDLDLPELASSYEEAEARALADRLLKDLKAVRDERGANDAELRSTLEYYVARNSERQEVLSRREGRLLETLQYLYSFTPPRTGKSVQLLNGRIGTRKRGGKWCIVDPDPLLAWAKEHTPSLVTVITKETVRHADLVKRLAADEGDAIPQPPGVEWEPEREDFYAEPV